MFDNNQRFLQQVARAVVMQSSFKVKVAWNDG